ncbi:MAG: FtsX-like permease family protein [Ilumatobacteraceae bacterium]
MSAIQRGVRNAFRNPLRTISVTAILGISLGLVVVMLAARSAVSNRISEVKSSIGNTVTISPAGARGFLGGGEPLTQSKVEALASIANVTRVDATVDAQLRTDTDTSLKSGIEAGTLGRRQFRAFNGGGASSGTSSRTETAPPEGFTPPILAIGTNDANNAGTVGTNLNISSGTMIDPVSDANSAVIGATLATKNSLSPGSTFTAYGTTITVSGIYDAGNEFSNNSVVFPLKTLQRLSTQNDQLTAAVVNVDSSDHIAAVTAAVKSALADTADVTSSEDTVAEAVKPLENIRTIATTSFFGALVAAAVITLLTMVMIVRERRKEIAVLKAIGAGDATIVTQFVTESVALSLVGGVFGTILGFIFSNPILSALVSSTQNSGGPANFEGGPGGGGRVVAVAVGGFRAVRGAVQNIQAAVDLKLVLYGLLAAVAVAIVGSAFPAWLIAKIRPAEVLRSE